MHLVDLWNVKQVDWFIDYCRKVYPQQIEQIIGPQLHIYIKQLYDYLMKSEGIVGLTEDPAAPYRCLMCAPLATELRNGF